ncbi:hypothetical protein AB0D08_03545 [Kitasatospora sp. NPDC048540]|uniref:hypothetical protein n=1 Tax=Kitasatospora sp. NPDC048540 TaxID=3155634 RepID=UPI0034054B4A
MLVLLASPVAAADPPPSGDVTPCKNWYICVGVTEPGSTPGPGQPTGGGSGGGGGGVPTCSWNGQTWPCWDDDLGWFSTSDGCYYQRSSPQPPATDPAWAGHTAADGALYEVNCRGVDGQLSPKPPAFFAQPPGGPPPDRPAVLGRQALDEIRFDAPELHAAPADNAVVGMPVWLWYTATPHTSGTQSATARGVALSVTATAKLTRVIWTTGDKGTDGKAQATTCTDAGTPYRAGMDPKASPCSHVYTTGSAKLRNDAYYLKATLVWRVDVIRSDTGAKVFNSFDYQRTTDVPLALRVGEVQVLN